METARARPRRYASLKDRTLKNMDRVSIACMISCCMVYIFAGMFGYLLLGDSTPDDIIEGR
jgi:amino acid permease